jgi:hypothetical protein
MTTEIDVTLASRGARYGRFVDHARIVQRLKRVAREEGAEKLSDSQAKALDMIFHKIGRILAGDPNYADSWHDIAGYASLIDKELSGNNI